MLWICGLLILLRVDAQSITKWEEVSTHSAWKKLQDAECGDSATDRIIGGKNAALGQFPWIVRLGFQTPDDEDLDFMCGGALVTKKHVITAAHCIKTGDDDIKVVSVRIGEYDITTNPDCYKGVCAPEVQDRSVKSVRTHSSFNSPAYHNDIAVVELSEPITLNDYVAPICLPRQEQLAENLDIGELLTVAGWGKMNMSTEERANILQVISLPVVAPKTCDTFGKGFKVLPSEICAGAQSNKDACGGDSGGPLMKVYDTPEGPKTFLVGVVSFGPTLCGIKKPGVYTSIAYYLKWILDNIV